MRPQLTWHSVSPLRKHRFQHRSGSPSPKKGHKGPENRTQGLGGFPEHNQGTDTTGVANQYSGQRPQNFSAS